MVRNGEADKDRDLTEGVMARLGISSTTSTIEIEMARVEFEDDDNNIWKYNEMTRRCRHRRIRDDYVMRRMKSR